VILSASSSEAPALNQDPIVRGPVPARDELELSLADIVAPLRRRGRFITLGTGICWAVLLVLVLVAPLRYHCEGTLVLPDLAKPKSAEKTTLNGWTTENPGIPVALYKEISRAISDGAVMQAGFSGKLSPSAVEKLRDRLDEHVAPITSGGNDELQKLGAEDSITAIKLSYVSFSSAGAREVVETLGGMAEQALIGRLAADHVESQMLTVSRDTLAASRQRATLQATNQSLETLTTDLERLSRLNPKGGVAVVREIVDTREGGYRYLPPEVQLVGAKAQYADNAHSLRILDQTLARLTLEADVLRRLQQRIGSGPNAVGTDPSLVIDDLLKEFSRKGDSNDPARQLVETELRTLRDDLATIQSQTRFIQNPTVGIWRWTPLAAAAASVALVFFVAAALVADLWQRGSVTAVEGALASRKSA
jgi:hypothetical protein